MKHSSKKGTTFKSSNMASPSGSSKENDILAYVRYKAQNFVVCLNPYDGWEQWQKVLAGLAPGPVEIVLLPDKAATCVHENGISIIDRRSYMEAMKVVEAVRQKNDVLRFVLYPVIDETNEPVPSISSAKAVPLAARGDRNLQNVFKNHPIATLNNAADIEKTPLAPNVSGAAIRPVKLEKTDEECPKWAHKMKQELTELIDERFSEMSTSIQSQMSMISSHISDLSSGNISIKSFGSERSSVVIPTNVELEGLEKSPLSFTAGFETSGSVWSGSGRRASPAETPVPSGHVASPSRSVSDSGSVSVLTQPDSFVLVENEMHGNATEEISELENTLKYSKHDEQSSETGSVVYVETDNEDEDDMANLRSWAGENSSLSSTIHSDDVSVISNNENQQSAPMIESFVSGRNSMENSFHSVTSEQNGQDEEYVFQETIVYKPITVPIPQALIVDAETEQEYSTAEEYDNNGETTREQSPVESSPLRPQATAEELPRSLNAMQPIDEQNLFSPNSNLGTIFLSIASSITNQFQQSMESLSRALSSYEEQMRQVNGQHQPQNENVQPEPVAPVHEEPRQEPRQEPPVVQVPEIPQEVPPPVPPRANRNNGPPINHGQHMTREEIGWYLTAFGLPELLREDWTHRPLTHDEFTEMINQYFDRRG